MTKNLVEQLRYAGGNDEGLGGYCEALIIRVPDNEKYVLHRYGQYIETVEWNRTFNEIGPRPKKTAVLGKHEKIEFETEEELLKAFPGIFLREWETTDRCCGYDIPREEFEKADESRFEKEFHRR
jgi:hypothetical protein